MDTFSRVASQSILFLSPRICPHTPLLKSKFFPFMVDSFQKGTGIQASKIPWQKIYLVLFPLKGIILVMFEKCLLFFASNRFCRYPQNKPWQNVTKLYSQHGFRKGAFSSPQQCWYFPYFSQMSTHNVWFHGESRKITWMTRHSYLKQWLLVLLQSRVKLNMLWHF